MEIEKVLKTIKCKEYCDIKGYKYKVIYDEYIEKVYIPNYYETELTETKYIDVKYPEIYICELENMNIIGENSIVFDDIYSIYDMPFRDNENRYRLGIRNTIEADKNKTRLKYSDECTEIESGIMLISPVSYNYHHLNLELFSKLCLINEIREYSNYPLIVDKIVLNTPQFKEELDMLNTTNRKIIYIDKGSFCNVKKLIHISDLCILPLNMKYGIDYKYADSIISKIGINLLNKNLAIESNPYKKIFISRKSRERKRLQNWMEVELVFKSFGYEIVCPEELSFKEQLDLFSKTKFIAGASGAGLTNTIFANKSATLICIYPKEVEGPWYSNLSGIRGQKTFYLDVEKDNNFEYYAGKFNLDIKYLKQFLEQLEQNLN